jgi:hypothetical protein
MNAAAECIMPERDLRHRVLVALLAMCWLGCFTAASNAAVMTTVPQSTPPAIAAPPAQSHASWSSLVTPELLAQGAGAFIGFAAYSAFLAPEAAAAGGLASMLGGRLMATTVAGAGAVVATYAYDLAAGLPLDYEYFWHRGGFIVGVGAGIAAFGVLGLPAGTDATWLGWTANRAALLGSGLLGAWAIDHWQRNR